MFEQWKNRLEKRITYISSQNFKPAPFSFERFLICISCLYGFGVKLRLCLYSKGLLKQKKLSCFVISIGNIISGGTGKTPMAIHVAEILKKMGKKVVVISRGYKGKYKNDFLIVSDGHRMFCNVDDCGDEPYMMAAKNLFPVIVGKNRFKAGIKAIEKFRPDVIILDDGFQHLKLKRDLDLLLFDYSKPLGNNRLLPAGRLRQTTEMPGQKPDALIFTRTPDINQNDKECRQLTALYPGRPWFKTFHSPYIFKHINNSLDSKKIIKDFSSIEGQNAVIFSGIAKNSSFYLTMKNLGINILEHLEFKDHYRYKEPDILTINNTAATAGAKFILTTEKDWIKLDPGIGAGIEWAADLIVIGIQIEFEHLEKFSNFLNLELKKI